MKVSSKMDTVPYRQLNMRYIEPGEVCLSATEISVQYKNASGIGVAASLVGRVAGELELDYVEVESYPEEGQHWVLTQRRYAETDVPSIIEILRARKYGYNDQAPVVTAAPIVSAVRTQPTPKDPNVVGYALVDHSQFDDDIWAIMCSEHGKVMTAPWRRDSQNKVEYSEWNSSFNSAGFKSFTNGRVMKVVCNPDTRQESVERLRKIASDWYDRRMRESARAPAADKLISDAEQARLLCRCGGGHATLKQGIYGSFFGCSSFPQCRLTSQFSRTTGLPLRFFEPKPIKVPRETGQTRRDRHSASAMIAVSADGPGLCVGEICDAFEKDHRILVGPSLILKLAEELGLDYIEEATFDDIDSSKHWLFAAEAVAILFEKLKGLFIAVGHCYLGLSDFDDDIWAIISDHKAQMITSSTRARLGEDALECFEFKSLFKRAGFRTTYDGRDDGRLDIECKLVERAKFVARLSELIDSEYADYMANVIPCPCGGHGVTRKGAYSTYLACTAHPYCLASAQLTQRGGMLRLPASKK